MILGNWTAGFVAFRVGNVRTSNGCFPGKAALQNDGILCSGIGKSDRFLWLTK